jgi:hypothetical protein
VLRLLTAGSGTNATLGMSAVLAGYEGKADGDDPAADRHAAGAAGRACDRTRGGANVAKAQREAKAEQVNKAPRFFQTA